MRSFARAADLESAIERVRRLTPQSTRRWGRMTPQQMMVHLADAFRHALGARPVSSRRATWVRHNLIKWYALWVPLPWPHGYRTRPELDAEQGGTRTADFERDRAELEKLTREFVARVDTVSAEHPSFGRLNRREWLRFGWLHHDHHLRQFGL